MPETVAHPAAVIFPDAEWLIVAHLRARLPDHDVTNVTIDVRDRQQRPKRFITTRLMGGTRRQLVIGEPIVSVQVWPGEDDDNGALANLAEALVYSMEAREIEGAWVRAVTPVGGVQFFPDPDTDLARYQFTVQLNLAPNRPARPEPPEPLEGTEEGLEA